MIKKISIFASGNGLNTFNLIKYFKNNKNVEVSCVITNNPNSGVILISKDNNIPELPNYQQNNFQFPDSK